MSFGKYKGKSIQYIFDNDNQYLLWLIQNANEFRVDMSKLRSDK
jgi:uncharacterized protein (DUF3820 family)